MSMLPHVRAVCLMYIAIVITVVFTHPEVGFSKRVMSRLRQVCAVCLMCNKIVISVVYCWFEGSNAV